MNTKNTLLVKMLHWVLKGLLLTEAIAFVYALYRFANSSMLRAHFSVVAVLFVFFIIGASALAHLLVSFIGICKLLLENAIFSQKTVKYLKAIARDCLWIAFCFFLNFVFNLSNADYVIFKVDLTGIHTDVEYVIFLFAGCFISVLAHVFEQAVAYKEDQDLTI